MTTLADDAGDEDATLVCRRPAPCGVAQIDDLSEPPDHSPTIPDASCAPEMQDPPVAQEVIDALAPNLPAPPEMHARIALIAEGRPSWWRGAGSYIVGRFAWMWRALVRIFSAPTEPVRPSALYLPPPPIPRETLVSAGEVAEAERAERMLDEVFGIPSSYLRGLELVVCYARILHEQGPDAILVGRVHLALSRMHAQRGGSVVSIGRLREHLRDVDPRRIDRALLDLEAEGALALLPPSMGEEVGAMLLDELRGPLGRIELRRLL
jgi:hypothetical protein